MAEAVVLRVLFFIGLIYIGQLIVLRQFGNPLILPGMMMMGSLAVPLATAFLFFELNTLRNIPFHRVLTLVCKGGMLSILISVAGFDVSKLHALVGAPAAGIVEETGKLLAVVLLAGRSDKGFILNGCLFGAAVGAGFAAFESAGWAFAALLGGNVDDMVNTILLRGVLAPFGHVTWTAITAGALWRARARHEWMGGANRSVLCPNPRTHHGASRDVESLREHRGRCCSAWTGSCVGGHLVCRAGRRPTRIEAGAKGHRRWLSSDPRSPVNTAGGRCARRAKRERALSSRHLGARIISRPSADGHLDRIAGQFRRTVIGSGPLGSTRTGSRNRLPSRETLHGR